jgi:hypothetical protein
MLTFRKILFPMGFSARCIWFAPYVGALARKFASERTLFHALDLYDALGCGAISASTVYRIYEVEANRIQESRCNRAAGSCDTGAGSGRSQHNRRGIPAIPVRSHRRTTRQRSSAKAVHVSRHCIRAQGSRRRNHPRIAVPCRKCLKDALRVG